MAREQFMVEIEFILYGAARAEPPVLGAWLRLNAYSAERLLGGRLKDAKLWSDGVSFRTVGLPRFSLDEVAAAEIAWWDGDDLVLIGYDLEGERIWKKKSKGGKEGNRARWSNRTPNGTPTSDSDGMSDSDSDPGDRFGVRIGDSVSVCESEGESDSGSSAREAPDEGEDARVAAAAAAGGWQVDKTTGEILTPKWLEVIGQLTPPQVVEVFTHAKRLTGHDIRYPSGFAKALEALRKERRAALVRTDEVAAQRSQDDRRAAEQARLDQDRRASAYRVERLDAWLASDEGIPDANAITENPEAKRWLDGARKHARIGAGANLALTQLAKAVPSLARFQHLEVPTPEGSAP